MFPARWENPKTGRSGYAPACANEWVRGVCGKPQIKCGDCPNKAFIPVTGEVVECHLRGEDRLRPNGRGGDFVAGVYPLFFDDTCGFLAVDFDDENWAGDARAFMATCRELDVPAALERSRSGNGGHVWLFFSEPIAAADARRLGTLLLTRTMNCRPEIGFASYDRLFPSQDSMPSGGFGNLIALPLQRHARENGNSVFVDDDLRPHDDQWAFLSRMPRLAPADVAALMAKAEAEMPGGITGVRLPVDDENADEPWKMTPSRRVHPMKEALPEQIDVVLADQVYVDRTGLPSSIVAQLVRIAAFQNPSSIERRRCGFRPLASRGSSHVPSYIRTTLHCRADVWTRRSSCSSRMAQRRGSQTSDKLVVRLMSSSLAHSTMCRQQQCPRSSPTITACWPPRPPMARPSSGPG